MKKLLSLLLRLTRAALTKGRIPAIPVLVLGVAFAAPIKNGLSTAWRGTCDKVASGAEALANAARGTKSAPDIAPRAVPVGEARSAAQPVKLQKPTPATIRMGRDSASVNVTGDETGRYTLSGTMLEKAGGVRIQKVIDGVLVGTHQTESSGRLVLVGDKNLEHKAFGPLQTRQPVCDDIAAFYGVKLTPEECQGNWQRSEYAYRLYVGYWLKNFEKNGGKATAEVACRIWNGGPTGPTKTATKGYWQKVKSADPTVSNLVASN